MVSQIYISYTQSAAVTFCFWKYFFDVCGVEIRSAVVSSNHPVSRENGLHLVILGSGDSDQVLSAKDMRCVYFVKEDPEYKRYFDKGSEQYRNDIIPMVSWSSASSVFPLVLEALVTDPVDQKCMKEILWVFMEERFWSTAWLYREIAGQDNTRLNELLLESCGKTIKKLQGLKLGANDYHRQAALLYCEYIQCGIREGTLMGRMIGSQALLARCGKLAKSQEWTPALCIFAGKICALSQIVHKYALDYYKNIPKIERSAAVLCKMGYIYENYIGNNSLAMRLYDDAAKLDPMYFYALYKQGVHREANGDWMAAYTLFNNAVRILEGRMNPSISVWELECYCKVIRRLYGICERNINGDEFTTYYRKKIRHLQECLKNDVGPNSGKETAKPEQHTSFTDLFQCMGMDETSRRIASDSILEKFRIPM